MKHLVLALAAFFASCAASAVQAPTVIHGFSLERIATVLGARELAITPNGDMFVGTNGSHVEMIRDAESTHPAAPVTFASFADSPAAGVALSTDALYVGAQFTIYRIPYRAGDRRASSIEKIAAVRTSGESRDHVTTSVAWDGNALYASIGSSCNACRPELDGTRATIERVNLTHHTISPVAIHIRNAIALTANPATHAVWAGVAGSDELPAGHPYEIFDDVTAHARPADYGWPSCYENHLVDPKFPANCAHAATPRIVFPAYETPIGAVFYPSAGGGKYAFPASYRGGAFVTLHGSWHGPAQGLAGYVPPRVIFIPMRGDTPTIPIDWNDPTKQWHQFIGGYQSGGSADRIGRPTGIAVGPQGSLFVADDQTGAIYRIRPMRS